MKKFIFNSAVTVVTMLLLISCSSDSSSDDNNTPTPSTENSWRLNNYNFSRRISTQVLSSYTDSKPFTLIQVQSTVTTNNNNFKFCSIDFVYNTHQTGTYLVKSENTVVVDHLLPYMSIKCTVTDTAGKGAIYSSNDSALNATVTKVGDQFVIDVPESITMTKTFDDGLENAPATMNFKCQKVR